MTQRASPYPVAMTTRVTISQFATRLNSAIQREEYRAWLKKQSRRKQQVIAAGEFLTQQAQRVRSSQRR